MADSYRRRRDAAPRPARPRRPQPTVTRRGLARRGPPARAPGNRGRAAQGVPLSWRTRVAVALSLLGLSAFLVLAGSGALATAATGARHALGGLIARVGGADRARPTAAPVAPAPRLVKPPDPVAARPAFDVRGHLPSGRHGRPGERVRVYVNGKKAKEQPVGQATTFLVRGVPLRAGRNEVTAAIAGPRGEGERSPAITLVYDVVPPTITITEPVDGSLVNASGVTLRGITEPESKVTVRNGTTGASAGAAAPSGRFALSVTLAKGRNVLTITAVDAGRNRTETMLRLVRGEGQLTAALSLSRTLIYRSRLPAAVTLKVRVVDADGRPVDGARVTFSISPPGVPTSTFESVTAAGEASWTVTMPRDGPERGSGLATALVVLPDGRSISDTAPFRVR